MTAPPQVPGPVSPIPLPHHQFIELLSDTLNELGPRGSLSDEGRVLRWCLLDLAPDEGVRELTYEERLRSWGGREVRWTLSVDASRKYAAKLHEDAMKAMAENDAAAGV